MVSHYSNGKVIHRAVNACLAPIMSVHRAAVTTVEGIGSTKSRLHKGKGSNRLKFFFLKYRKLPKLEKSVISV